MTTFLTEDDPSDAFIAILATPLCLLVVLEELEVFFTCLCVCVWGGGGGGGGGVT